MVGERTVTLVTGARWSRPTAIVARLLEEDRQLVACDRRAAGLSRAFSRPMVERGFGRIVNFTSVYAHHPRRFPPDESADPEEIAIAVAFLLSEESVYITRQTIHVNGGLYL
jgi:NAD(P)-dependent dehydrogenase (short-subunit alcohol dehydrogenase family)